MAKNLTEIAHEVVTDRSRARRRVDGVLERSPASGSTRTSSSTPPRRWARSGSRPTSTRACSRAGGSPAGRRTSWSSSRTTASFVRRRPTPGPRFTRSSRSRNARNREPAGSAHSRRAGVTPSSSARRARRRGGSACAWARRRPDRDRDRHQVPRSHARRVRQTRRMRAADRRARRRNGPPPPHRGRRDRARLGDLRSARRQARDRALRFAGGSARRRAGAVRGRPQRAAVFWNYDVPLSVAALGALPTELVSHFFRSVVDHSSSTCTCCAGETNNHHLCEAAFKAFARAFAQAGNTAWVVRRRRLADRRSLGIRRGVTR